MNERGVRLVLGAVDVHVRADALVVPACAPPRARTPDFLFPRMGAPKSSPRGWRPAFLDYLYVSFTNASAFSPTDAMPLSVRIKTLMLIESIAHS